MLFAENRRLANLFCHGCSLMFPMFPTSTRTGPPLSRLHKEQVLYQYQYWPTSIFAYTENGSWRVSACTGSDPPLSRLRREQFLAWHLKVLDKYKSKSQSGGATGRRQNDIDIFPGFKPAIEACHLSWVSVSLSVFVLSPSCIMLDVPDSMRLLRRISRISVTPSGAHSMYFL